MMIQEEARLSGLKFLDDSSSLEPQWRTTSEEYKPLLDGCRYGHASVVLNHDHDVQSIVVMGGLRQDILTNSVILWDSSTKQWRQCPSLNERRSYLTAETCNGKVYAIGGETETIECINVSILLSNTSSSNHHWETLACPLSTTRLGFATVVVHDRYVVIMGGCNDEKCLSTVEVLDTRQNQVVALSGLAMNSPRSLFGAAVVENSIYVVGGSNDGRTNNQKHYLDTVEFLKFNVNVDSIGDVYSTFGKSSSWTTSDDLVLSEGRLNHAVAKIGNCLVIAGGYGDHGYFNSVEVLDPSRHVVWHLPNMIEARASCSIAVLSESIVVFGGNEQASLEVLSLVAEHDDTAKDTTDNTLDWKSTAESHQQVATTLHNLGILLSNIPPNERKFYVAFLEQINYSIQRLCCHQENAIGNDVTTDTIDNLLQYSDVTTNANNADSHRFWKVRIGDEEEEDDDDRRKQQLSIRQRMKRLEEEIPTTLVQRMFILEQSCGIVNGDEMKLEDRIAQLEQYLE